MKLTEEQQSQLDDLKWSEGEVLQEDIDLRKQKFIDAVNDLREEMKDDINELRKYSKDELKDAIKDLKESWR